MHSTFESAVERLHKVPGLQVPLNEDTTCQRNTLPSQGRVDSQCCLVEPKSARRLDFTPKGRFDELRPEIVRVVQQRSARQFRRVEREILTGDQVGRADRNDLLREQ